jgi:hypothetical protein
LNSLAKLCSSTRIDVVLVKQGRISKLEMLVRKTIAHCVSSNPLL